MPLLTLAALTLGELTRRRLVLAVFLLTVCAIGATGWGFSRLHLMQCGGRPCGEVQVRLVTSQMVILVTFMFSFVLAIGSAFIAAPAIAADVESGVLLSLLPRPIRRSDIVLGRWLGLTFLVAGYTLVAAGVELMVVWRVTDYAPPHPIRAILCVGGEGIVLLTLALFLSTRLSPITGGVIAVVAFGLAWFGGIAGAIGSAFDYPALVHVGTVMNLILPTDSLWHSAMYNLEPQSVVLLGRSTGMNGNPFFAGAPSPTSLTVWSVAWVLALLVLAVRSFERRDL